MRIPLIAVPILLAAFCAGCWEGAAPTGPAPGPDTLRIVDTLTIRDTVQDTVATPLGPCSYRAPQSDTLAGDFAPFAVGNEWVYGDTTGYSSETPISRSSGGRKGFAALRLMRTLCKEGNLEHAFRFGFKGTKWEGKYNGRTFLSDSAWEENHEGMMTCRDDGTVIICEGLAQEDAPYLNFFGFKRALVSEIGPGVDPFSGNTASGAISTVLNGFANVRYWRGAGALDYRYFLSSGTTGSGFSRSIRMSLVSFNGIPTPYR